jgi:putative copper export protein
MLSPSTDTIRVFVHLLAATVWVGGQLVLAGLVPSLRAKHPEVVKTVANAYARVAWPAFAVLVVTGMWNLVEIDLDATTNAYQATVLLKVTLAVVSGVAAAVHQVGRSKVALAVGGAVGLLAALATVFLGILLRTGT